MGSANWRTGSHPTRVGLRGFPRSPRAPSSRYWGEPSNFERWRLVFLSLLSPKFLGRSLGKMKNSFKRTVSHPASVAAATEGVAGANAVIFQKQKKANPEEIPSVRNVVLFTDLHGEKGAFSVKAFQLVIAQVTCCNQIAEFSARCTT